MLFSFIKPIMREREKLSASLKLEQFNIFTNIYNIKSKKKGKNK